MRRMLPALLLIALLGLAPGVAEGSWPAGWYKKKAAPPVYPEVLVTPAWLRQHQADSRVRVVDARPRERYQREHVAGALHFDAAAASPDPATLGARLAAAGIPSSGILLCCSDRRDPNAAGRLFWLLELAGHRDVRVLNGGLDAWRGNGGAVASGPPPESPARFTTRPDTSRIADFRYVLEAFGRPGYTIMDWRTHGTWDAGHIPYSLPFPLERLVARDGTVLDGPSMRPFFETFGPRANDPVDLEDEFVVCGDSRMDEAPIHPYLAARLAGIRRVRCYPEGFEGWRIHPEAAVVRVVSARELRTLLEPGGWGRTARPPGERPVVFDLRGPGDYRVGHIPGAVLVPVDQFERAFEDTLARLRPRADRGRLPLVFYCYGPDCVRSRVAMSHAARRGWRNLLWFRDGLGGWQAAGMEPAK